MGDLTPVTGRTLRPHEVYLLAAMYWPYEEISNAVAVAGLESSFRTDAHNTNGEDSRGIWQINVAQGAHPHLSAVNLFDPQVNAYYAYRIWQGSGWKAWYNSARQLHLLLEPPANV